jgi:hypothetical protein
MSFDKRSYEQLPDGSTLVCPGTDGMLAMRIWPSGAIAGIESMIYTVRITIANPGTTFGTWDDMWCLEKTADILRALREWSYPQVSEPLGWIRNPTTNRRRIDGDPNQEYSNEDEKRRLLSFA